MAKYLVMHGMVGEWLQGAEVTAEDLGGADNIDRLIKLGAIEETSGAAQPDGGAPIGTDGPPAPSLTTGQPGGAVGATDAAPDALETAVGDKGIADALRAAGFATPAQVGAATDEQLRAIAGIGDVRLAKLREYAKAAQ